MTYPPINNIYKCWKEKINPRGLKELKKSRYILEGSQNL